jgi:rhodanese-related sulfurtransferase/DNA-binding transcriptional ArsR family regulator
MFRPVTAAFFPDLISMPAKDFKKSLYEQFARIGKAFSNAHRIELLEVLAQGERTVEALARTAGLTVANTSQHLQLLRNAGLVSARKEGQFVYYRLADGRVVDLIVSLRELAERHLAEVERLVATYLTVKDELEPIEAQELMQRVADGLVTVLDVRPNEEFDAGHIHGALNIPFDQLEDRLNELQDGKQVVAYCRGPYCMYAYEAVETLRNAGVDVRRLREGFPEWKQAGLPVDESAS